jgi:uncharacterized delta-60 repeat protein
MRLFRRPTVSIALAVLMAMALPAYARTFGQLTPGQLDPTFGQGGKATALPNGGVGTAVLIDSHGRAVTAGYTLNGRPDFVVARFLQNGTLDTTFGDLGRTILNLGGADYARAIALQVDGKLVVAGESDSGGKSRIAVARFNANGRVDTTFGGQHGFTLTSYGKDHQAANAVIVTPDDKIVVAGFTSAGVDSRSAIVRYGLGGGLDHSFGGDGRVSFDLSRSDEQFEAISWDEGNYVLGGYAEVNHTPAFSVADVTNAGRLNDQFSKNGFNTTNVTNGTDIGYAMLQQPDGKILVAGRVGNSHRDDWGVVRYLPQGGLDQTWGHSGKVITTFGKSFDVAYGIAMQANGKIVVAGRVHRTFTGSDFGVVRYNTDGSVNMPFGTSGKAITDFDGSDDGARGLVIRETNGKILVVGQATKDGVRRMALARYIE